MAGAGFKTFAIGDVLTASDVNTYLMQQAVMAFASSGARGSAIGTATEGMVSYLADTDVLEVYDGAAWTAVGIGKTIQVVTATDATDRSSSSTSFTDANISVSITPLRSDSTIYVTWSFRSGASVGGGATGETEFQITDSSDTALQGAEAARLRINYSEVGAGQGLAMNAHVTVIGSVASTDTSARTYKGRFRRVNGNNVSIENASNTGRLIAMEVV